ncbi:MAG: 3-deoxy-manno-octulosonate cytidylyltransferase [Bacteroidota bacterium]
MKILGVIPARYASSRFPGKPLINIKGKSMIQRVYEQCRAAELLDEVTVATDDQRIFDHVGTFGGKVRMTADHHRSGTERMVEIAESDNSFSHFVNIQGDEPFIDPSQIDLLCKVLTSDSAVQIATLVHKIRTYEELINPNMPKVVRDEFGNALYFSRSPIPYIRKESEQTKWLNHHDFYRHIGIYAFEREVLLKVPKMKKSVLEEKESLEQLRWLANGYKIRTAETNKISFAIDSPEDLDRLLESLA